MNTPQPTSAASRRLRLTPHLLCAYQACVMAILPMAVISIFWKQEIGLSLFSIMLIQGFFGLVMALFEFPSGYLADRLGYRRTLLLAATMGVIGWLVYARADSVPWVLLAEALLGIGLAFGSGCDDALLYSALKATGDEARYAQWTGRMRFWAQFGEGTGALTAGLLYVTHVRLPFALQAGMTGLAFVAALLMIEPARARPPAGRYLGQALSMVRHVLVDDRALRALFAFGIVLNLASFTPVWLIQIYAVDAGLPTAYLGPLWAAANYVVAIGALLSHRLGRRSWRGTLIGCVALVALGYGGLAAITAIWGFAFYYALTLMRGLQAPLLVHAQQRRIPDTDRAGFLSLASLVFRLSFLLLGPAVGWLADQHGQRPVLWGLGAVLVTLATLAWRAIRRAGVDAG